ncbi:MAG: phosphoesterase [Oscillospiraceae bacterium]|nr:phosphoesterase [Oscillospiraceae bacterium]
MSNTVKCYEKKVSLIDIHTHIVFNVDDGPSSIEESLRMVSEAKKIGVQSITATPHFNEELYNIYDKDNNFEELKNRVKENDIKLFPGYEVFLTEHTPDDVKHKSDLTLNHSRYILFELPFDHVPEHVRKVISRLNYKRYTPILAHPERYRYFVNDFNLFISVIGFGCLVQADAASIIGIYGNDVKRFTNKLIKMDLVHCVASNAHCADDYIKWYVPAYKQVEKWTNQKTAGRLFYDNPENIVYG